MVSNPPRFTWISLPCTRLSPLQNLTERTEEEWSSFIKRRGGDLKRADEISQGVVEVLETHSDLTLHGSGQPTQLQVGSPRLSPDF